MSEGHHTIKYIEFTVRDLQAAKRFYAAAFGWQFNDYGPDTPASKAPAARSAGFINRRRIGPRGRSWSFFPTTWSRAWRRFGRPAARSSVSRSSFPAAGVSTSRIQAATSSPLVGRLIGREAAAYCGAA